MSDAPSEQKSAAINSVYNVSPAFPRRIMRKVVIDPEKLKKMGLNRKIAKALTTNQITSATETTLSNSTYDIPINTITATTTTSRTKTLNKINARLAEQQNSSNKVREDTTTTTTATSSSSELKGVPLLFEKYCPQLDYNTMTPDLRLSHVKNILQTHLKTKEKNISDNENNAKDRNSMKNKNKKTRIDYKGENKKFTLARETVASSNKQSTKTTTAETSKTTNDIYSKNSINNSSSSCSNIDSLDGKISPSADSNINNCAVISYNFKNIDEFGNVVESDVLDSTTQSTPTSLNHGDVLNIIVPQEKQEYAQVSPLKIEFLSASAHTDSPLQGISPLVRNTDQIYNDINSNNWNTKNAHKKSSKTIVLEDKILSQTEKFDISSLSSSAISIKPWQPIKVNSTPLEFTNQDGQPVQIIENEYQSSLLLENDIKPEDETTEDVDTPNAVDFLSALSETLDSQGYELTEREKRKKLKRESKKANLDVTITENIKINHSKECVRLSVTELENISIENIPIVFESDLNHHTHHSVDHSQQNRYLSEISPVSSQLTPSQLIENYHANQNVDSELDLRDGEAVKNKMVNMEDRGDDTLVPINQHFHDIRDNENGNDLGYNLVNVEQIEIVPNEMMSLVEDAKTKSIDSSKDQIIPHNVERFKIRSNEMISLIEDMKSELMDNDLNDKQEQIIPQPVEQTEIVCNESISLDMETGIVENNLDGEPLQIISGSVETIKIESEEEKCLDLKTNNCVHNIVASDSNCLDADFKATDVDNKLDDETQSEITQIVQPPPNVPNENITLEDIFEKNVDLLLRISNNVETSEAQINEYNAKNVEKKQITSDNSTSENSNNDTRDERSSPDKDFVLDKKSNESCGTVNNNDVYENEKIIPGKNSAGKHKKRAAIDEICQREVENNDNSVEVKNTSLEKHWGLDDNQLTDDTSPLADDDVDIDIEIQSSHEKKCASFDFDKLKKQDTIIDKEIVIAAAESPNTRGKAKQKQKITTETENVKDEKNRSVFVETRSKKRQASQMFLANLKNANNVKLTHIKDVHGHSKKDEHCSKRALKRTAASEEVAENPQLVIMTTIVKKSERIRSKTNRINNIRRNDKSLIEEKTNTKDPVDMKNVVLAVKKGDQGKKVNNQTEAIKEVQTINSKFHTKKENFSRRIKNESTERETDDEENQTIILPAVLERAMYKKKNVESTVSVNSEELKDIDEHLNASSPHNEKRPKSKNKTIADYFKKMTEPAISNAGTGLNTSKKKRGRKSCDVAETAFADVPIVPPKKRARKSAPAVTDVPQTPPPCTLPQLLPKTEARQEGGSNMSTVSKKRAHKPDNSPSTNQASALVATEKKGKIAVSDFNPRLLLIRTREQLDSDEILTASDNTVNIRKSGKVQCSLCLEHIDKKDWKVHRGEHYGAGWIVGSGPPLDYTKRSQVLSSIIQYYKENKSAALKCRMCERAYRSGLGLLIHLETCGIQAERVECPHCQKLFSKLSINVHERVCQTRVKHEKNEDLNSTPTLAKKGRTKRISALKAQAMIKSMDAFTSEPSQLLHHAAASVSWEHVAEKYRKDIEESGKADCVHYVLCKFTTHNWCSMWHHYENCSFVNTPGFYCTLCATSGNFKCHETEAEALLHIKSHHMIKERKTSGSDFENKSNESQSSSDDDATDGGGGDDDDDSGITDEKNSSIRRKSNTVKKQNNAHKNARRTMFPVRCQNPTALAKQRWAQFVTLNYSAGPLFQNSKATYELTCDLNVLKKVIPDHLTSMKFAFSPNTEPVKKLGEQPVPETLLQLKRFESTTNDCEFLMYLGGSVKHIEWVPLPHNSTKDQYLCISYRMHSKYTKTFKPEIRSDVIIVYTVAVNVDINPVAPPILRPLYALHIKKGPVHCFEFLPSGGYDAAANRLGLIAVGTAGQSISIYALPLHVPESISSTRELLIIDVPPAFVLMTLQKSMVSVKQHLFANQPQCLKICWSEYKGHKIIAASFTNGYIGLWNVEDACGSLNDDNEDDFDRININVYYKNNIMHFKAINYFYNGGEMAFGLALHYDDAHGVRWLAATTLSRKFVVYDISNLQRPLHLKNLSLSSLIPDIRWSPIWESLMLGCAEPVQHQNNGDVVAAYNPTSLTFTRTKVDGMNSGLTQVHYNAQCNVHAFSCDNGDLILLDTREMYLDDVLPNKTHAHPRAIATLDLLKLDGEPLPNPTVDNQLVDAPEECSLIDVPNYMDDYALIFMPMTKYLPKWKNTYLSAARHPHLFAERMMRVNSLRLNRNCCDPGHQLLAVGYDNGFLRVMSFKKSSFFR